MNIKRNLGFTLLTLATALFVGYGHNARMANAAAGTAQPSKSFSIMYQKAKAVSNVIVSDSVALLFSTAPGTRTTRISIGKSATVILKGEPEDEIRVADGTKTTVYVVNAATDQFTYTSDLKNPLTVSCMHAKF